MSIYEELHVIDNIVRDLHDRYGNIPEINSKVVVLRTHLKYLREEVAKYGVAQNVQIPVEVNLGNELDAAIKKVMNEMPDCPAVVKEKEKPRFIVVYPPGTTLYKHDDGLSMPTSNFEIASRILDSLTNGRNVILAQFPGWRILQWIDGVFEEIVNTGDAKEAKEGGHE